MTLDLPEDIALYLAGKGENLPRAALEALALEAYRERKLSAGQMRRLPGYGTRMQVHAILKAHDVFLHSGQEDLKPDRQAGNAVPQPIKPGR